MQMEQPTPSHVDTNQINFTSDEETDKKYIRVSGSKPPDHDHQYKIKIS